MNINKDEKFLDEEKDENSQGAKAESNEIKTSSNDVPNEEADSAKEASTIEKARAEETNPSIDKNTNKPEDKKDENKKKAKKKKWIFPTVICSISLIVGIGMGYLGYAMFGKKGPSIDYGDLFEGYNYLECAKYSNLNSILSDKELADDPTSQAIAAANTSLYKLAKAKYFLTYEKQAVIATVGIKTTQDIEAVTYASPEVTFNQNISSSSFVHTADRFYDYGNSIDSYRESTPDKWKNSESKSYTYDQFIQSRGKLLKRLYFLNVDSSSEHREYLTDDESQVTSTTYQEQAVIGYDIGPKSITSATIQNSGSNYLITIEMDYTTPTGFREMGLQMQMTGGLSGLPNFSSVEIQMTIDKNLNMIKNHSTASYNALIGGINAQCSSESTVYYFTQDEPFKDSSGTELKEPAPHEQTGEPKSDDETKLIKYSREKSKEVK